MPQHGFHAGRVSLERQDFHLALNRDTQCGKPLFKQTFRLRLWEHKSKGIGTLGALHTDAAYDLVACDDVNRIGLEPSINKRGRAATPVKQFEGTAPNNQSLGLVCPMGRLIDNPNRHPKPREFGSHRHSDWTGTNNQDGHIHHGSPISSDLGVKVTSQMDHPTFHSSFGAALRFPGLTKFAARHREGCRPTSNNE
jgi:hypothetical protein